MQLCIILNNMYHVKQALAAMSEKLDLNSYYQVSGTTESYTYMYVHVVHVHILHVCKM